MFDTGSREQINDNARPRARDGAYVTMFAMNRKNHEKRLFVDDDEKKIRLLPQHC